MNVFKDIIYNESGVTAIEYAIIAGLIILVITAPLIVIGRRLFWVFARIWAALILARLRAAG